MINQASEADMSTLWGSIGIISILALETNMSMLILTYFALN